MIGKTILWAALLTAFAAAQNPDREDPLARFESQTKIYKDLWHGGHYQDALEVLKDYINASTDGVPMEWLYNRADLFFDLGRVDEAIAELEWLHYRRPSPKSALQLLLYYKERGRMREYQTSLNRAADRYRRYESTGDDTESALAMAGIKELLGENPRALFQEILTRAEIEPGDALRKHMAAGDLALRKFDFQLAAEQYQKALEREPDQTDAMAGLAECYWRSYDPRLDDTLAALFAINPNHPRGRAIKVEMLLDSGDTAEARALIEKALAINPNSMRFAGLKAAALFLDDELPAMRVVQQEALQFNGFAAEVYRIPGRIASRHYRFFEGSESQRRALDLNPEDHYARALYAFDLLRMGRNDEGRKELEKSFAGDRFNVQVYNMLNLLDTLETFEHVADGPFSLRMPKRELDIWGRDALAMLREAFEHFSETYDVILTVPVHVQIFDSHDDFMVRSVGLPGSVGYLGICFGELITMDSPSAREKGTLNWQATLWHEFVHVVTLQKTRNRIPRWLSEGISVFEETRRNPAWGQRLDLQYRMITGTGELPGVDDLEVFFTRPKTQLHLMFGYFLAGEFVNFYVAQYGFKSLVSALAQIGEGSKTVAALEAAAGGGSLDKPFRDYLRKRLAALDNLPVVSEDLLSQPLPNPAEHFLSGKSPFTNAFRKGREALEKENWETAEAELQKASDLFPEFDGPDGPLDLLAGMYRSRGNKDKLRAVLERKLSLSATDDRACAALATLYEESGDWAKWLGVTRAALYIDPFDIAMRRKFQQALVRNGKQAEALIALAQLAALDGAHAADYRLQRVDLLAEMGLLDKARGEVIRLLEEMPYSWEGQQRLLKIVERTDGGETP